MEQGQIIGGGITAIIAVALGIYTYFAARGRGPILSNTYVWLNKDEQKKVDKKAEYRLVTIIFGCLTAVFAALSLHILTRWQWTYMLMWVAIAGVVVYAIADAFKTEAKRNGK